MIAVHQDVCLIRVLRDRSKRCNDCNGTTVRIHPGRRLQVPTTSRAFKPRLLESLSSDQMARLHRSLSYLVPTGSGNWTWRFPPPKLRVHGPRGQRNWRIGRCLVALPTVAGCYQRLSPRLSATKETRSNHPSSGFFFANRRILSLAFLFFLALKFEAPRRTAFGVTDRGAQASLGR